MSLVKAFREQLPDTEIIGLDNLSRPGSWLNKPDLLDMGVKLTIGDIRSASDLETLPKVDWVIDAAANPSVLAGVDGKTSSRQLVEHNLQGTINLLEYCRRHSAGFILLSTSRVYSIPGIAKLKMQPVESEFGAHFAPDPQQIFPEGISERGVSEDFSMTSPVSLYGSTKIASELLALEYGESFNFPVWINRCGVMAGAGQFGHPAQGIFAFWIHSFRERRPVKYIGFGGKGYQVRDCLHPRDLLPLLKQQMASGAQPLALGEAGTPSEHLLETAAGRIVNVAGGIENSMSLNELTGWCQRRYDAADLEPAADATPRPFDIPWMVLDPTRCQQGWNWQVQTPITQVLDEIADFADAHPEWLKVTMS